MKSHPCEDIIGSTGGWLAAVKNRLDELGLDISGKEIDHLCYRCDSKKSYIEVCEMLVENHGSLLVEGMIGGRPISTIHFHEPICFLDWKIPCIEITCPKPGKSHNVGLEHIEVVIGSELDCVDGSHRDLLLEFVSKHPDVDFDVKALEKKTNADVSVDLGTSIGSAKFHVRPLYEVCQFEKDAGCRASCTCTSRLLPRYITSQPR